MEIFINSIFGFAFFLVYVLAFILLKPFRIHRKRKISTITLKVTYLIYLVLLLTYAFINMFLDKSIDADIDDLKTILLNIITLFAFAIPNVIIMFRRRVKKNRAEYNVIFSIVNCVFILYFLFLLFIVH